MTHAKVAKKASEAAGGTVALARAIGRSASEVSQWASGNRPVPLAYCAAIERATNGAVTRKDLRPLDWHLIWPELAEASGAVSKHALRPDSFGLEAITEEEMNV